jgi:pimeloyl-ACP methyl ester carboxylesterase
MSDISLLQAAKTLGSKAVSDIVLKKGLKWPPPPVISIRTLLNYYFPIGLHVTNVLDPGDHEECCFGIPNPQLVVLTTDYQLPPQYMSRNWFQTSGRVDPLLRFYARMRDPRQILTSAVKVFLGTPIVVGEQLAPPLPPSPIVEQVDTKYCRMLSQLAVTGRTAFAAFAAWHPEDADLVQAVIAANPGIQFDPVALQEAVRNVLDFAYETVWAIRANDETWRAGRLSLGWIATSGEDDLPHRPVNVPSAPYPQFDLDVAIPNANGEPITITTRYIAARPGHRLVPPPDCSAAPGPAPPPLPHPGRALPVTDPPNIAPTDQILIYLHGGSSRLEESVRFVDQLLAEGARQGRSYTVIAMDLLNSGYSTPVEHTLIAPGGASYRPSGGDAGAATPEWPALTYGYPMMDTEEQFILNFIEALEAKVGNIKGRVAAVMGGSLGGNMAMRLGRRSKTSSFLSTIIAWSVTCMRGPVDTLTYEAIKGTVAGCGADMVNKFMAPETPDSRNGFFEDLYQSPVAECGGIILLGAQPPMWYGDSWPCKLQALELSRFDRYEYYTPEYRRWTVRLNFEMAVYSFQNGDLFVSAGDNHPRGPARYLSVNSLLLLASGAEDNYPHVDIFGNTRTVAGQMANTPGTTLFLAKTGHSIYEERPTLFAQHVVAWLPAP